MQSCKAVLSPITRQTCRNIFRRPNLHTTPLWKQTSPIRIASYHKTPFLRFPNAPSEASSFLASQRKSEQSEPTSQREQQPAYEMTFTCKPCSTRSTHRVSKQAYHQGSVLITCPQCKNRHLIADHLNIFGDKSQTIEDILREKGELFKKGTLSETGDLEFWDDGSTTARTKE